MNPIGAVANRAIPHVRGFKPRLPVRIVSNRAYLPVEDCFKTAPTDEDSGIYVCPIG